MNATFLAIMNHEYVQTSMQNPFHMLIYNGDVDFVCDFFMAEFFVDDLAAIMSAAVTRPREEWFYSLAATPTIQASAGFRKSYNFTSNVMMDLLTVKGSGHFVPLDRSGPALQMLYNFLGKGGDYNVPVRYSVKRQPLKPEYRPNPPVASQSTGQGGGGDTPPTTQSTTTTTTTTTTATPQQDNSTVTDGSDGARIGGGGGLAMVLLLLLSLAVAVVSGV